VRLDASLQLCDDATLRLGEREVEVRLTMEV
jgi:hypothetical protein